MESRVPCRNVHTGPRHRQEKGPIVSYCASSGACTGHGYVSVNKP